MPEEKEREREKDIFDEVGEKLHDNFSSIDPEV